MIHSRIHPRVEADKTVRQRHIAIDLMMTQVAKHMATRGPTQDDEWHCYGCDGVIADSLAHCDSCGDTVQGWKWGDN